MCDVPASPEEETFRPSFSRLTSGALIAMCSFVALVTITEGSEAVAQVGPWLALVGLVTWALYWRPKVVVSVGGIRVVNVFRTIEVPWPAIKDVSTKWSLTLETAYGPIRAWAAPAPGRQMMRRAQPEDRRVAGQRPGDAARPSDLPQSESGAAAQIVRQRWLKHAEAGYLDNPQLEFDKLKSRWNWDVIGGLALVVPLVVLSLAG